MKELDNNRIEELLPRYCEGRLSEEERLSSNSFILLRLIYPRFHFQTFLLAQPPLTITRNPKVITFSASLADSATRSK